MDNDLYWEAYVARGVLVVLAIFCVMLAILNWDWTLKLVQFLTVIVIGLVVGMATCYILGRGISWVIKKLT